MGFADYIPFMKKKEVISEEEKLRINAKNWMPIKNIRNGIIELKNGNFIKLVEVTPINFKLKSRTDRRFLIYNYRSFLKACRFPMQISIQCKKADVDPHIKRISMFLKTEKNPNAKNMLKGYIKLVKSLSVGTKGAVSRRFFLVIPYVKPIGIANSSFSDIEKQMIEKVTLVKEFLDKCGNDVTEIKDTAQVADILYTYMNKRTCEVQKIGEKMNLLTGMFLNMDWEEREDDEEEDEDE